MSKLTIIFLNINVKFPPGIHETMISEESYYKVHETQTNLETLHQKQHVSSAQLNTPPMLDHKKLLKLKAKCDDISFVPISTYLNSCPVFCNPLEYVKNESYCECAYPTALACQQELCMEFLKFDLRTSNHHSIHKLKITIHPIVQYVHLRDKLEIHRDKLEIHRD